MNDASCLRAKWSAAAVLFGAVAALCLTACGVSGAGSHPAASKATAAALAGVRVTPPIPKPEFTLTDTSGQAFDFQRETQGHLTLLYFGYTNCPDICPLQMLDISTALKQLPAATGSQAKVVFVTTDPGHDTPAVLRQWLDHFNASFIGLTGTPDQLDLVQRQAGVPVAQQQELSGGGYGVDHAAFVIAYTPDNLAHVIYPAGVSPQGWAQDLSNLLQNGWTG